jgi:hypothetical protein
VFWVCAIGSSGSSIKLLYGAFCALSRSLHRRTARLRKLAKPMW